jgi:hypothetical protein|tara:strand:+ start:147068 stop:148069 length:1002 start_codon:yes stop_codon:yes gene_type:complete
MRAELLRGGYNLKEDRNNLKICCPFPHEKHEDRKYKLGFLKDGSRVHCWNCKWSGSWNKFAETVGLEPFGSTADEGVIPDSVLLQDPFRALSLRMQERSKAGQEKRSLSNFELAASDLNDDIRTGLLINEPSVIKELSPWDGGRWRGLGPKLLKALHASRWERKVTFPSGDTITEPRIFFPYLQHQELKGYVGRRLDGIDKVKYLRAEWNSASSTLFPFDFVRERFPRARSVCLVEGEVDALNLISSQIPALSILGTGAWSSAKREILSTCYDHLVVVMDPDPVGADCARKIIASSASSFKSVVPVDLPPDEDPGTLDKDQKQWLKNQMPSRA